jgi:hypothetical protein
LIDKDNSNQKDMYFIHHYSSKLIRPIKPGCNLSFGVTRRQQDSTKNQSEMMPLKLPPGFGSTGA